MQASHTVTHPCQKKNNTSYYGNTYPRLNNATLRDVNDEIINSSPYRGRHEHRLQHNMQVGLDYLKNEPSFNKEAIESSSTNVAKVPPVTKSYGEEDPSQKTVENSSLSSSAVVEFNSCTGAVNLDYTDVPELVSLNSSIVRDFFVDL
nr:hypothetical protein BgiMline_014113 [Biomphalaria glabrata]